LRNPFVFPRTEVGCVCTCWPGHQRPAGAPRTSRAVLSESDEFRTKISTLICRRLFCAKDMCISGVQEMAICGYARVSTDGQTLAAQDAALKAAGCTRVYSEKVSGAITDRKALAKALAGLEEGDTLIVTRLDRLARSTRDLLNTLDTI